MNKKTIFLIWSIGYLIVFTIAIVPDWEGMGVVPKVTYATLVFIAGIYLISFPLVLICFWDKEVKS